MRDRVISLVVLVVAIFEFCAIYWNTWPTITALIRPHRDDVPVVIAVSVVVLGIAAWALVHLLGDRGRW